MKKHSLVYLSNAVSERLCHIRSIRSDSPAATQKVLQVAAALNSSKVKVAVLSLGRGGQNGTWRWYKPKVERFGKSVFIYAPFFDAPVLTHLVTLLGLLPLVWRLRPQMRGESVLLAYNRLPHYMFALEFARWLQFKLFLDLEDGDVSGNRRFRGYITRRVSNRINSLCKCGALLASAALVKQYPTPRTMCCYGVAGDVGNVKSWDGKLNILLGGSLQQNTGVGLFIAALKILKDSNHASLDSLEFVITGKGDMAAELQSMERNFGLPQVRYLGSVSRQEYRSIVERSHVGLCLKLASSDLGDTTFPSKVVEITSSGMLLLSTLVSDVPLIFDKNEALFLSDENPATLANAFCWLFENRGAAEKMAKRGQLKAEQKFDLIRVGTGLKDFFFLERD